MNFKLTEDQQALSSMVRDLIDKEVRSRAHEIDMSNESPDDLWYKYAEMGLLGIIIPEEYGGSGGTYMDYALATYEASKGCASIAQWISGQTNFCFPILKYGTEEQKQKYVIPMAKGTKRGAFALTEPGAGSDAGGMRTKAVLQGDKYVINGSKTFISHASEADFFVTFVLSEENGENTGPIALVIEKDTPGMKVGKHEEKMGLRGTSICEVVYEDCIVPIANRLGKPGEGFRIAMAALDAGRLGIGAMAAGVAQEALDLTIRYVKERKQFGKRISEFQNTQFVLAELQTKVHAAYLILCESALALDNNEPARMLCSMAKYLNADICNDVTRKCLQFFGGYGFIKEYPIERLFRDAKIFEIFEGTAEIQRKVISKELGIY